MVTASSRLLPFSSGREGLCSLCSAENMGSQRGPGTGRRPWRSDGNQTSRCPPSPFPQDSTVPPQNTAPCPNLPVPSGVRHSTLLPLLLLPPPLSIPLGPLYPPAATCSSWSQPPALLSLPTPSCKRVTSSPTSGWGGLSLNLQVTPKAFLSSRTQPKLATSSPKLPTLHCRWKHSQLAPALLWHFKVY